MIVWQNYEPTLAIFCEFWANLNCCKWPNNEKYSRQLVTLGLTDQAWSSLEDGYEQPYRPNSQT